MVLGFSGYRVPIDGAPMTGITPRPLAAAVSTLAGLDVAGGYHKARMARRR